METVPKQRFTESLQNSRFQNVRWKNGFFSLVRVYILYIYITIYCEYIAYSDCDCRRFCISGSVPISRARNTLGKATEINRTLLFFVRRHPDSVLIASSCNNTTSDRHKRRRILSQVSTYKYVRGRQSVIYTTVRKITDHCSNVFRTVLNWKISFIQIARFEILLEIRTFVVTILPYVKTVAQQVFSIHCTASKGKKHRTLVEFEIIQNYSVCKYLMRSNDIKCKKKWEHLYNDYLILVYVIYTLYKIISRIFAFQDTCTFTRRSTTNLEQLAALLRLKKY